MSGALISFGIGSLAIDMGTDFIFSRPDRVDFFLALVTKIFLAAAVRHHVSGCRPVRAYLLGSAAAGQL